MGMACSAERYEPSPTSPMGETKNSDEKGQADETRDIYLVTVPRGASTGQQLLINTNQGAMRVRIPPGVGPGQQFRASVPRATSTPTRGGALSAIPVDNPFQNQAMIRAFEVRGAGSSVVNGVYQADQQVDGVQAYRKVGTNIMLHRYPNTERRGTSIWWIADWGPGRRPADGDDTDYYFASSSLGLPPQSGWRIDSKCDGGLPAPVVAPHGVSVQYYQQQIHHHQQQQLTHSRGGAPIQLIRSLPESKYHCRKQSVATSPSSETPKKAIPSVEGLEKENGVDEVKASEPPSKEKNGFCRTTNETCCICLESFKEGESIIRLPCFHIFHSAEISKWLLKNHRCPLCQTSILRGFMEIDEKAS
mmetsp:Transcript_35767/g.57450  ORF Transcript_35767/g.57450 Transcript_35767/m.57450 type:complete len:362 (-) Transcript_35767:162-1247(-)